MGFTTGDLPPVDIETFADKPYFERIRVLSDQLDVPVHCHVHETAHEVEDAIRQHGMRQIARLDEDNNITIELRGDA